MAPYFTGLRVQSVFTHPLPLPLGTMLLPVPLVVPVTPALAAVPDVGPVRVPIGVVLRELMPVCAVGQRVPWSLQRGVPAPFEEPRVPQVEPILIAPHVGSVVLRDLEVQGRAVDIMDDVDDLAEYHVPAVTRTIPY